jgi:hypothetical protein
MEENIKAFPSERLFQHGMSLRDYFAAKVLQGLLASSDLNRERFAAEGFVDNLVKSSYIYADAMMEARSK